MDAEVWFYLVIAAISIIVSVAGKKNKQKEQRQQKPYHSANSFSPANKPFNNPNKQVDINDLLGMFGKEPQNIYEEEDYEDNNEVYQEVTNVIDTVENSIDKIEEEEGIQMTLNSDNNIIAQKPKDEPVITIDNFSVEQAIIYSEILKRREY